MTRELAALFLLAGVLIVASGTVGYGADDPAASSEEAKEENESEKSAPASGLLALAAALAVGLCAIGTGIAQGRIGAAGCGALAERPEVATTVILLVAIPETMVILGFVVAVVILFVS